MNFQTLEFSDDFLESLLSKAFSRREQLLFLKAPRQIDIDERHPSLRIHPLQGEMEGVWSASANDELRITFERLSSGRKRLHTCSRHYRS